MLVLWFTCPQNVVDVSRDHDHHDANDGEAARSARSTASNHLGSFVCLALKVSMIQIRHADFQSSA